MSTKSPFEPGGSSDWVLMVLCVLALGVLCWGFMPEASAQVLIDKPDRDEEELDWLIIGGVALVIAILVAFFWQDDEGDK